MNAVERKRSGKRTDSAGNPSLSHLAIGSRLFLYAIFSLALPRLVAAATIPVSSFVQDPGAVGDCTLGEAIRAANLDVAVDGCLAGSGSDVITLPAGDYPLTAINNLFNGPNGLPSIATPISINGAGAATTTVRRSDDPAVSELRIFHVAAGGDLELDSLTIADGVTFNFAGGGVFSAGIVHITDSVILGNVGGGIFIDAGGTLTLTNSTVSENENGGSLSAGIYSKGVADIAGSAISHNQGFGSGDGMGGVRNDGGVMSIINSTIERNFAHEDSGAGVRNEGGGALTIANSTITQNKVNFQFGVSGGIFNDGGTVSIRNTVLVGNEKIVEEQGGGQVDVFSNCAGPITSLGNNVIGASTVDDLCVITPVASDVTGVDAGVLGAFTDDGTPGHGHYPLLSGSPAIDAGNPANPGSGGDACEATDQLGFPRPADGNGDGTAICDVGAIELASQTVVVNDELAGAPDPATFAFDPAPVPEGPAGTFSFTAAFCNTGEKLLTGLKSVTKTLGGGNALVNRDGATPSGVGSERTFPATQGFADGVLSPGECVDVLYVIGLAAKVPFGFTVDVVGAAP